MLIMQVLEELVGGMDDSPLQADELPLAALLGGSSSAAAGAEGFGDLACPMSPLHCAWECFLGESHEHQPITAAKEQQGLEQLKGPHGWSSGAVAGLKSRRPSCMSDASNAGLSSPWASVPLPSPAGPSTADGPGEAGSYCLESGGSSSFALPWDLFPQLSVGAAAAAEGQGQVCAAGPGAGLSTLADVDTAALCAMVDWTDLVDWVPSSGPQLTLFGEHPQQPRAGVTAPGQRKQSGSRSKKAGAAGGSASDRRRAGGAGAGVQGPAAVALMGEEGEADAEVVAAAAAAAAAAVVAAGEGPDRLRRTGRCMAHDAWPAWLRTFRVQLPHAFHKAHKPPTSPTCTAAAEGAQDGASQGLASPASDKRKRQPSVRRKRWGEVRPGRAQPHIHPPPHPTTHTPPSCTFIHHKNSSSPHQLLCASCSPISAYAPTPASHDPCAGPAAPRPSTC